MKKIMKVASLVLALSFGLAVFGACGDETKEHTSHPDANNDGICDIGGEKLTPSNPNNPNNPNNPDNPDKPDNPDNPDKPNNPDNPDKPDNPDNPDNPGDANKLTFADFTAEAGAAGIYYTASIAKATGAEGITYAVASGSTLPEGLNLLEDGFLHGMPAKAGNVKFKVTASADGKESATAEVSLTLRRAPAAPTADGTINFPRLTIDDAMVGEAYLGIAAVSATASNQAIVTYAVQEGSEMPAGLTLYPNGTVYGTPTETKETRVMVTASAEKCPDSTQRVTFDVKAPAVPYEKAKALEPATVGEAYSASVASELLPEGVTATYKVAAGTKLPAGLTLSEDGMLTGTPTASARSASFGVTASATGYSDATCSVSLAIKDREVEVTDGKFEAEYIDLTGKAGGGYSGSSNQEEMVQRNAAASNGYYLGYTHSEGTYEFKFKASAAATGVKLEIGLASELMNAVFTPKEFGILVNGKEVSYASFNPVSNGTAIGDFKTFTVGNIDLVEGDNVITLIVRPNTFMKGVSTGGPCIDFIQISTTSKLTWTPCLYNVARFN